MINGRINLCKSHKRLTARFSTLLRAGELKKFNLGRSWRGFQKICCNSEAALVRTGFVLGSCPEPARGRWQKSQEGHQGSETAGDDDGGGEADGEGPGGETATLHPGRAAASRRPQAAAERTQPPSPRKCKGKGQDSTLTACSREIFY